MKKLLFITLSFLIFACSGGDDKNDLNKFNLKGKVKSIKTTSFFASEKFEGVTKDDWIKNGKKKFDDKGNQIETASYDEDGYIDSKYTYKYKFDDKGNQIEEGIYFNDGGLSYKYKYKYDDKGNQIETARYNKDGELSWKEKMKYDDKGNQIEMDSYDEYGELSWKYKYKYDDKGNLIEIAGGNVNNLELTTFKITYELEYDGKDNWIKKIKYKDDKPTDITEREIEYYNSTIGISSSFNSHNIISL